MEALVHHADRELRTLMETKDPACIGRLREDVAALRELHPFFKVTELEWNDSLTAAEEKGMKGLTNLLPRKRLSQISSELYMIQRQIKEIFYRVLDVDREKSTVLERLEVYFSDHEDENLRTYSFRPLITCCEKTPRALRRCCTLRVSLMWWISACGSAFSGRSGCGSAKTADAISPWAKP